MVVPEQLEAGLGSWISEGVSVVGTSVQLASTTAPTEHGEMIRNRFTRGVLDDGRAESGSERRLRDFRESAMVPPMALHVVAHEGEPESGAARDAAVVGGAPSKEPLEDLFSFLERDARTVVVDVDRELITLKAEAHRDRALA